MSSTGVVVVSCKRKGAVVESYRRKEVVEICNPALEKVNSMVVVVSCRRKEVVGIYNPL